MGKQVEILDQAKYSSWNDIVASFPEAHVLQTYEWAFVKSRHGWKPFPRIWTEQGEIVAAGLILEREQRLPLIPISLRIIYVPKGPLLRDWGNVNLVQKVLNDLQSLACQRNAIFIKIDPDLVIGWGIAEDALWTDGKGLEASCINSDANNEKLGRNIVTYLRKAGWHFSREQIQFRNTVISDLRPSEDEILEGMKQKTRYNIRLAERKGVVVREGGERDFSLLYDMYKETALRDGFLIRERNYYETVWKAFINGEVNVESRIEDRNVQAVWHTGGRIQPTCKIFIAEVDGEAVAGIILLIFGRKAWYMYGMSTGRHREKMPNHLLHWNAMRHLKSMGVEEYDWWGAPDKFSESDPMYGVFRFKEGFGGRVCRHIGAWDYSTSKPVYLFYQQALPLLLKIMKARRSFMS